MNKRIFLLLALLFHLPLGARLYFLHIPKTAGTTLRLLLEMQVSAHEIYPSRNRLTAKNLVAHDLVSGHLPYWLCKKLDPDFEQAFKITVLRDPIERYLSFLRSKKKKHQHPDLETVMNHRFLPSHPYQIGLVDNGICRFLAAHSDLEGEELLKSAKEGLEKLDCVLFFESFHKDVVELFGRLGIPLDEEDIPITNTTKKEEISEEFLEKVREHNFWDLQLYEYAKTHLKKKETHYSLRGESFDLILRRNNSIDYTLDLPLNGKGWSDRQRGDPTLPHPIYRTATNQPATLYFSLEEGRNYELLLTTCPSLGGGPIKVYVNNHEVNLLERGASPLSLYEGAIEKEWVGETLTEISFFPENSLSLHRIQIH